MTNGLAFAVRLFYGQWLSPWLGLALESADLLVAFLGMLLFVGGQKSCYLDLLRGLIALSSVEEKSLVSA